MENSFINPEVKISDDNMSHFNRYTKQRGTRDARRIYHRVFAGDIATLGRKDSRTEGYPFCSVAPFILDYTGNPVIFTADLAEHTKNAFANGKASLMMRQVERQQQIETGWRLACVGELKEITGQDRDRVGESYLRYYPEAKQYMTVHDFHFFRLNLVVARIIMGFGKISWVEAEDLAVASPFTRDEESGIIEHMNNDHEAAIKYYLKNLGVSISDDLIMPRMVAISQFGAVIDYHHHLHFVAFDEVANDVDEVRQQLLKLAKV